MKIFIDSGIPVGATEEAEAARQFERVTANLSQVRSVLAVASAKGGVGKSVLTVNIATALAREGCKVAIVDADFNCPSVAAMLGMKPLRALPLTEGIELASAPHGLRLVASDLISDCGELPISFVSDQPAEGSRNGRRPAELSFLQTLRRILGQTRFGQLDLVIVDLGPGLGELYRLASTVRLDGVLLLSHPAHQSVEAARKALDLAAAAGVAPLGFVENMAGFSCYGCRAVRPLLPEGDLPALALESKVPLLARLPFDPVLAEGSDRGVVFVHEHPDTPLGKALSRLAGEVYSLVSARDRV